MTERIGMTKKKLARMLQKAMSPQLKKESIKAQILREARKQEKKKK